MSPDPTSADALDADAANGYVRYAPTVGSSRWLFIVGRRFVAAVESTVSDEIVDTLWWLAGSEFATIESVVGAFPLADPGSVRSFAVAEIGRTGPTAEVVVTAVVRGAAALDVFSVGGSRRFAATGVQPWVLAEFHSVTGLVLLGDDAPTGPVARLAIGSLPVGLGVVVGEQLTWSLASIERDERSVTAESAAALAPRTTQGEPQPASGEQDSASGETAQGTGLFGHATALPARPFAGSEVAPPLEMPVAHELPGAIDIEAPVSDLRDVSGPRDFSWAAPLNGSPVPPFISPRFAARLGTGEALLLDRPIVFGRYPSATQVEGGAAPRLVSVVSLTQEVSGTHVRIEQSGDAVLVTDLRSTNGTWVIAVDGTRLRLRPGESTVALAGEAIAIGDGNIIEIVAVPGGAGETGRHREGRHREEGRE